MERRELIRYSIFLGSSLAFGSLFSCVHPLKVPTDERMGSFLKGIQIIDAHAHPETLKRIVELAERSHKPILDSHTSPCPDENSLRCGRFRKWKDMEKDGQPDRLILSQALAFHRLNCFGF